MHTGRNHLQRGRRRDDRGFTLVELLIVIVILGILATVTVFAVRGITDQGQDNAEATELRTFETAVESYWALNGSNPTDAQALVDGELLSELPTLYSYADLGDGTYTLTNVRTGDVVTAGSTVTGTATTVVAEPDNVVQTHSIAGYDALRYGQGSKSFVYFDNGRAQHQNLFNAWVAANPPIADTQFILVTDPSARNTASVEDILALGNTAYIAPYDFSFQWTINTNGAAGNQVPIWWLRPDGFTTGQTRPSTGTGPAIGNVQGIDTGQTSLDGLVTWFNANY